MPPDFERLWAPWRLDYVAGGTPEPRPACFICAGLASTDDRRNLLVCRTAQSVVLLNRYPYNNGHLLVAPRAHKAHLRELTPEEILDTQRTLGQMLTRLENLLKPEGFNVGLNLGKVAGAGLPGHLHWHLVPRWNGDTNFMPVLAGTRVIVQSLEALYDAITQEGQESNGVPS